jgi:archaellum component FlaC|tara:strand:- start:254 stop:478 length:225 start_codon:yes stop_codon:yes gene_type:complete
MEMEPQTEREHIISIQGHITGVKRELNNLKEDVQHVHKDVEKLGGKIDTILWVVLSTVGAVGLIFIETLLGMMS